VGYFLRRHPNPMRRMAAGIGVGTTPAADTTVRSQVGCRGTAQLMYCPPLTARVMPVV